MIYLLEADPAAPVALITFTRLSRRTTSRAIQEKVSAIGDELPGTDIPRVATVHQFAKGLVHTYPEEAGLRHDFHVLIDQCGEVELLVSDALVDVGIEADPTLVKSMIARERDSGDLQPVSGLTREVAERVRDRFDELSRFYNAIDIQALVLRATGLIGGSPERLTALFLHVDEYQDLNAADQGFIRTLVTEATREVVAVGDDAQSIYLFRHARREGIRELFADTNWDQDRFDSCLRLPAHIKYASQELLRTSGIEYLGRFKEDVVDPRMKRVPLIHFSNAAMEVKGVVAKIKGLKERDTHLQWRDFMVLCPSKHVGTFVRALGEADIPTRVKTRALIDEVVWHGILALRIASADDSLAMRQVLALAGVNEEAIRGWASAAISASSTLFDYVRTSSPPATAPILEAIDRLRSACEDGPEAFLQGVRKFPGLGLENVTADSMGFDDEARTERPVRPRRLLGGIYERVGILDPEEDVAEADAVLVTTPHSSKGLEAKFVFVTRVREPFLPQLGADRDEQRRVLYVSMTRAKQEVFLSLYGWNEKVGNRWVPRSVAELSPFLGDIQHALGVTRLGTNDIPAWGTAPQ